MPCEKLYYTDPYQQKFTATVDKIIDLPDGRFGVVLDRTAFYPEGGGQPSDTGLLDDIDVISVSEKNGEIIHITAVKPRTGTVHGHINWSRRFDHMQQHTGEHLLSAAFLRLFQAENIGFHLGVDSVTIDVTLDNLSQEEADAAEKCANEFVFANLPIGSHHVSQDQLPGFALRKPPSRQFASIRLVEIKTVDCCPCGGTHVKSSGEVGLIKIRSWERKGGAIRVDFVCGWRALAEFSATSSVIQQLSARLSSPPAEIAAAVEKQLAKSEALTKALYAAKQELIRNLATLLYDKAESINGAKLVVRSCPEYTPQDLADLAKALFELGPAVALLGSTNPDQNKTHLLFSAASAANLDMAVLLKTVLPDIQGKGGGNAQRAQGGGVFTADLEDLLQKVGARLKV